MSITLTYPEGGALIVGGTGTVGEGVVRRLSAAGVPLIYWRVVDYDGISATSKAAIDSLTRQIAAEEGINGIRCSAVAIGWVDTRSLEEAQAHLSTLTPPPGVEQRDNEHFRSLMELLISGARLRRNAKPHEAGDLFAFLASDQASYITGRTIVFDGGTTL